MIQRFIYGAIKNGIDQITADTSILELLFEDLYLLDPSEVDKIKEVWTQKPPKVIHGYAPRDAEPPVYAITLQSENESGLFLGNQAGQICDPDDPNYRADVEASIWTHTYMIHCYTEHPDVTSYYYEIVKSILLANTEFFTEKEMFNINMSAQDLSPAQSYMPEHLFGRLMQFRCDRLFTRVDRDSIEGKGFKVGGIHIDKSGSPSPVGGVKTLLDPIPPDDLDGGLQSTPSGSRE